MKPTHLCFTCSLATIDRRTQQLIIDSEINGQLRGSGTEQALQKYSSAPAGLLVTDLAIFFGAVRFPGSCRGGGHGARAVRPPRCGGFPSPQPSRVPPHQDELRLGSQVRTCVHKTFAARSRCHRSSERPAQPFSAAAAAASAAAPPPLSCTGRKLRS